MDKPEMIGLFSENVGDSLLAGLTSQSQALLGISVIPNQVPKPEDIEKAREAVLFRKVTKLKKFNVRVFDLLKREDQLAYELLIAELFPKAQAKEIHLIVRERKLVEHPEAKWLMMLQWYDLDIHVEKRKDVMEISGEAHGQSSP